jgi:signal peptidase I
VSTSRTGSRSDDSLLSFLRELPVLLLVAFLLAFLLRTFVVQVFYIPSRSMDPTLQEDDRILVEKISYRFRDPARGEVVVFAGDDPFAVVDDSTVSRVVRGVGQFIGVVPADARDFVKRVIGLPGDVVTLEDGVVFVNGVEVDEEYVVYDDDRSSGPWEVPEGSLFVLGDNRPNSADSRFGLGYIDIDDVVGRAGWVIWPPDHAGSLSTYGVDELELDPPPSGTVEDEDAAGVPGSVLGMAA